MFDQYQEQHKMSPLNIRFIRVYVAFVGALLLVTSLEQAWAQGSTAAVVGKVMMRPARQYPALVSKPGIPGRARSGEPLPTSKGASALWTFPLANTRCRRLNPVFRRSSGKEFF